MNKLPLKIFYTLTEASSVLNERFNCTEVNTDYFLHLAMKEEIRLGVFVDPNLDEDNSAGVLFSEFLEFRESELLNNVKQLHHIVLSLEEVGSILVLNSSSVKDIFIKACITLENAHFDNVYSIDTQEFAVKGEFEQKFEFSKYFDKLHPYEIFEMVHYSDKHNMVQPIGLSKKFLTLPRFEDDDDWKIGTWFNDTFDFNQDMKEFHSEREIRREDCLILGEDLELLLNGKKRDPVTKHPRKHLDSINKTELNAKLHPKRKNSINQIVYGLAKMANLDLSQHQSAYNQFDAFCGKHGIEIPAKDTCGNLFKEVHQNINF